MRTKHLLGIGALALLALSCNNDEVASDVNIPEGTTLITASINLGDDTRAAVTDEGGFSWVDGDQIAIYTSKNKFQAFKLYKGAGEATGSFGGILVGADLTEYAVYPASIANSITDKSLSITLPTEYGSFDTAYAPTINVPMVAISSDTKTYEFKHIGGVLRIQIINVPKDAAQFVFTANTGITGSYTVDLSQTDAANRYISTSTKTETNTTVTIKFRPLTAVADGDGMKFYIPLPTGSYDGFKIEVKNQDGTVLTEYTAETSNTLGRAQLALYPYLRLIDVEGTLEDAVVNTNLEVAEFLSNYEDETNPNAEVEAAGTVTTYSLPESFTSEETTNSYFAVTYTDDNPESYTITQADSDAESAEESKGTTEGTFQGGTIDEFDIETPSMTSVVNSSSADTDNPTIFNKGESLTSQGTLVIGNNVVVKKLILKGGNIRIKNGGSIEAFEDNRGEKEKGKIVYVINETGNDLPTLPAGWIEVSSVQEKVLRAALYSKSNTTVKLESAIEGITSPLVVSAENVTIDLNGYNITPASTIKTAVAKDGSALSTNDALVVVRRGGSLVVDNTDEQYIGELYDNQLQILYSIVKLVDESDTGNATAKFTLKKGYVRGTYTIFGIVGTKGQDNTEVNIEGGVVQGFRCGIFQPQVGTVNVKGGTIQHSTQYASAVEISAGTLNVTGGKLYQLNYSNLKALQLTDTNSSIIITGAALSVVPNSENEVNINISDNAYLFTKYGSYAYAIYEANQYGISDPKVNINVTGGILSGKIYTKDCKNYISNGLIAYDTLSSIIYSYLTTDSKATVRLTSDLTVTSLVLSSNVTLDLYGHTLSKSSSSTTTYLLAIEGSDVKIKDSSSAKTGAIKNDCSDSLGSIVALVEGASSSGNQRGAASLTLESGNIIGNNVAIFARRSSIINLNGGTVTANLHGVDMYDINADDAPCETYINGATITVQGTSTDPGVGVALWPYKRSGEDPDTNLMKLVVSGDSNISCEQLGYAIAGNGSYHSTDITISGGTFTSASYAMYHPQNGYLKISGGSFTGAKGGIEIRSGNVEITGGEFISNATDYETSPNGSGTTTIGAAVSVAQHTTKLPIDVKISGGTFKGIYAFAENNPQPNDEEAIAKVKLAISGGIFAGTTSAVYSEDKTYFISGGKYTVSPDKSYIATGYAVSATADSDGYYEVTQSN